MHVNALKCLGIQNNFSLFLYCYINTQKIINFDYYGKLLEGDDIHLPQSGIYIYIYISHLTDQVFISPYFYEIRILPSNVDKRKVRGECLYMFRNY